MCKENKWNEYDNENTNEQRMLGGIRVGGWGWKRMEGTVLLQVFNHYKGLDTPFDKVSYRE